MPSRLFFLDCLEDAAFPIAGVTFFYHNLILWNAVFTANSVDPDQTPHSAASDLVYTVCQCSFYEPQGKNGLNQSFSFLK